MSWSTKARMQKVTLTNVGNHASRQLRQPCRATHSPQPGRPASCVRPIFHAPLGRLRTATRVARRRASAPAVGSPWLAAGTPAWQRTVSDCVSRERLGEVHMFLHKADGVGKALGRRLVVPPAEFVAGVVAHRGTALCRVQLTHPLRAPLNALRLSRGWITLASAVAWSTRWCKSFIS